MRPDQIMIPAWAIGATVVNVAWAAYAARRRPVSINIVTNKQVRELVSR